MCLYRIIDQWIVDSQEAMILKAHSPTIYGLYITISTIHQSNEGAKQACTDLLSELLEKRNNIFNKNDQRYTKSITHDQYEKIIRDLEPNVSAPSMDMLELYKTGCYFPGYPIKRTITDIKIPGEKFDCNKIYKQQGTMGPGTLYFFCEVHRKCIGFVILDKPESPRIVTQVLLTRFTEMPAIILYDNGCNLNEFIMNRYPNEFEKSRIFVDGFHFNSHNNCSNSYDSHSHPDITNDVNTSLPEQKNSRYTKMKATSPFLKLSTFMAKVRYSAMFYNTQ